MNDLINLMNKVCLPIALFGAINYGLIGLGITDLLSFLHDGALVQIAQIVIGVAGAGVALGFFGKK